MRVVCFHAGNLHPKTLASLANYAPDAIFADCSDDFFSYWRNFKSHWNSGQDLVTIEQDNEIEADTLSSFEACPEHWCTFPYRVIAGWGEFNTGASLGCTKFSVELQAHVKTSHISPDDYRRWDQVESRIAITLARYGYTAHVHDKVLPHHHEYA